MPRRELRVEHAELPGQDSTDAAWLMRALGVFGFYRTRIEDMGPWPDALRL